MIYQCVSDCIGEKMHIYIERDECNLPSTGVRQASQTRLPTQEADMGKTVAYVAAAVVFLGIGALVTGLSIWYKHPNLQKEQLITEIRNAQCVLQSTGVGGDVAGTLNLKQIQSSSPVLISGNITGLSVGRHGFHVHQWGVPGAQCTKAGGHYNPLGFTHSAPNATERHMGDLGNVVAVADGNTDATIATVAIKDNMLTLSGRYSIVGRAIVVHAGEDDLGKGGDSGSLKTGNAGGRVACCTMYVV
ncbi:Superoxide dismutase [Cu-Zn] [Chionoecetes opilio]|uniref:Superoxide dismutase [Cu-Zn] n=1 Tax=Chionoecetes opilio TaxID=41210 RepID=A0A8J5CFH8_CHIOP|nr:Superoxide dismutase [Cu-Zn] [Chionoecetes opilio]